MDETLIGRPFLNAIGFNLRDHLLKVSESIDGKHISEIKPNLVKLAASSYQGLSYMSAEDYPIQLPDCISVGIGTDSESSITAAFKSIIVEVQRNGISAHGYNRLNALLQKYRDIFRIKLGNDPPAKLPALSITPTPDSKPFRSLQRRYAPQQKEFIINTVKELEKVGEIFKNPSSRWASPALAVPNPGSSTFRFTVELRVPNSRTIPIVSAMRHLDSEIQNLSSAQFFANIDLAHGYWQIPLSSNSQEMLSIQTPIGVYSSNRLLQGGSDSGNHFQAVLSEKFENRIKKIIQWLEDFLLYAASEHELLDILETFFAICNEVGLKLHPCKSH